MWILALGRFQDDFQLKIMLYVVENSILELSEWLKASKQNVFKVTSANALREKFETLSRQLFPYSLAYTKPHSSIIQSRMPWNPQAAPQTASVHAP